MVTVGQLKEFIAGLPDHYGISIALCNEEGVVERLDAEEYGVVGEDEQLTIYCDIY
jgi:hypothetical protein